MGKVSIQRKDEGIKETKNGLTRCVLLDGATDDVVITKCVLEAGAKWTPQLYKYGEKVQWFFFMTASGYVATPARAHNITDKAIYVPDFDREEFYIQAGAEDLEFLHVEGKMNDIDLEMMNECHIVLPRFRFLKDSWRYTEGFTGDAGSNVKSHMVIEHEYFGRYSMGWNCGIGPTFIGEHIHPDLEQWYYALEGSSFTYTAGDSEFKVNGGDITHTPEKTPHGSKSDDGENIDYIWIELATKGYMPIGYIRPLDD